jgi:hypothetical protein
MVGKAEALLHQMMLFARFGQSRTGDSRQAGKDSFSVSLVGPLNITKGKIGRGFNADDRDLNESGFRPNYSDPSHPC